MLCAGKSKGTINNVLTLSKRKGAWECTSRRRKTLQTVRAVDNLSEVLAQEILIGLSASSTICIWMFDSSGQSARFGTNVSARRARDPRCVME